MTDNETATYGTIVEAETALQAAGYVRDNSRHVWVLNGKTAKVVRRETDSRFFVQRG